MFSYREKLIDDLRFSPNGKYLAFNAHTNPSDDRGNVVILRVTGEKPASSPLYESSQGLAWSPSGDEVWSTSQLESGEVHALSLPGKIREPLAMPGRLHLRDIGPNGQMLLAQGIARRGMIIATADGETQRDLSWLDFSMFRTIGNDGKTVLFEEEGNETSNYTVYVRDVDGSPTVPIGEGYGADLSPDKKWALAIKLTEPKHEVWLFPVGPGEARRLSPPSLAPVGLATLRADGKSVIYPAREGDHPARMWLQDLNGGAPRAISSEGITGRFLSPDDKWVLVYRRELGTGRAHVELLSIEDGKTLEIAGLSPTDLPLGWASDGQLYVATRGDRRTALHVEKLNPHTGARMPWRDLATAPSEAFCPTRRTSPLTAQPTGSTILFVSLTSTP